MKTWKKILLALFIVLFAILLLAAGGFVWMYFNGLSGIMPGGEPEEGQVRVACVGDSITYGHGVGNWPKNNYPAVLSALLGEDYHVRNFGFPGRALQSDSDQPYTVTGHYKKSLEYDCDILVFMMGSNDSKPENWKGKDRFQAELRKILNGYLDQNDSLKVFLCTPATAFFTDGKEGTCTNFDIQPEVVGEIADIVRETAEEYDCGLIDIHALTGEHPEWFEKDGVHPDKNGARAIAQKVSEEIAAE